MTAVDGKPLRGARLDNGRQIHLLSALDTTTGESTQDDSREGPERVSATTWNRFLAALDKWSRRAVFEGLSPAVPFRMVERTVRTARGVATVVVNVEREPDEQDQRIRFMPYEENLLWRDVGLRGQLPGGGPDPGWRGRHGERNAVFAGHHN